MFRTFLSDCKYLLILWFTQTLSQLGSSMTGFALVLWSYSQYGSALTTALLTICSYAPYVLLSIFAGALSDRWDKKKTMLVCDFLAAVCTLGVLGLWATGGLRMGHLYLINAVNGLMNTVQQPASDVAVSLLTPKEHYQRVGGLRAFSNSLVSLLSPVCAASLYGLWGLGAVIWFDLGTFLIAAAALLLVIRFPRREGQAQKRERVFASAKSGLVYLRSHRGVLNIILFLAVINLTASMFNAALPALLIPKGGEKALGLVQTFAGAASLVGGLLAAALPAPKSRVRVICNSLLFSMSTENFMLALGRGLPVWCLGSALGWLFIPVMNANLDALLRLNIPIEMQGRVYSARNTLQFFTIPLGYLLGGALVDRLFEPFMARQGAESLLCRLFGTGKGAGAALFFLVIGVFGALSCLPARWDRHIWALEKK
ncbi:MAG: MFS transporter [Oscillospiraceae bacterium]|nr:MFS transporter [Oscillospiraceae bacterium]